MNKINLGRKWKYGSMAIILSLLVIAAIIIVNFGATYLSDRFGLSVDLTSDNRYEISEATKKLLAGLSEHIDMYVIATEQEMRTHIINGADSQQLTTYGDEIVETLKKYESLSNGKINVEFVDVGTNPQFLDRFEGLGVIDPYSVIVTSERGGYKVIQLYQLYYWYHDFDTSYENSESPIGINVERAVASAILYINEDSKRQAAFVTNNGEGTDRALFVEFLEMNNFECYTVDLSLGDFKENTDLVVILSPANDYTADEIAKLENYLKKANSFLIVGLSAAEKELPDLTRFLADYGVTISRNIVFDTRVSLHPFEISSILSADEAMFDYLSSSANVIMPYALALELNEGRPTEFASRSIATSSESSLARTNADLTTTISKTDSDLNGPFNVACIATHGGMDLEGNSSESKILFLGSPFTLYDEYFTSAKYNNQEFISVILNDFFDTANLTDFVGKEFTVPSVILLNWEKQLILIVLFVIPILLLGAGVFVWLRRKNK